MHRSRQKELLWAAASVCVCYFLAHGYHLFQNMYSGDSLVLVYQNDYAFEIGLGRCFNPLWVFFRGSLLTPWLISALAMVWLTLGVFLTADYLALKSRPAVFFAAAALTMNVVLTCLNTAFIPWVDLYTLALFLNIFGVWLMNKKKPAFFALGAVCIAVALGTYQAYITVAVTLVMIRLLLELSDNRLMKEMIKTLLLHAAGVLLGGGIYFVIWKSMQAVLHIGTTEGYNGLAGLTDFSGVSLPAILGVTYGNVFDFFWNPPAFVSLYFRGRSLSFLWVYLFRGVNIAAAAAVVLLLIWRNRENQTKLPHKILQVFLMLLFPAGMNSVCLLSKGMEHTLMEYSFVFWYLLVIKLFADFFRTQNSEKRLRVLRAAAVSGFCLICWINTVFSNQVYLKMKLEEDATLSLFTRIVNDLENFEGYIPGETQVAFAGTFLTSDYIKEPEGFADLSLYMLAKTPLVYPDSEITALKYYLNSNMLLTKVSSAGEEVKNMPVYPQEGSIAYVGDVLVVKLSEQY